MFIAEPKLIARDGCAWLDARMFRFAAGDRYYTTWRVEGAELTTALDPARSKLLDGDTFDIEEGGVHVRESPARAAPQHLGVLAVNTTTTYGRYKGKHLFRCVPDDKLLPCFLIPYRQRLGFVKHRTNRFISFRFKSWEGKHPLGEIVQVIGDVSCVESFADYQLMRRGLWRAAAARRFASLALRSTKGRADYNILSTVEATFVDRCDTEVVTLDPPGSRDFDDAFGLTADTKSKLILSVYIANVPVWLSALGLWDHVGEAAATIYLPSRKLSMLPAVLSDDLCSLRQGRIRPAMGLDIALCPHTYKVTATTLVSAKVKVARNLVYDSRTARRDGVASRTLGLVRQMNATHPYLDAIADGHDMVAYLMLFVNHYCAVRLSSHGQGIFRTLVCASPVEEAPPTLRAFLRGWESGGAKYTAYGEGSRRHDALGVDEYCHITSPIRRLADLANMTTLLELEGLVAFGEGARLGAIDLDHVNRAMRGVKRVQSDCALLAAFRDGQRSCPHRCSIVSVDDHETEGKSRYTVYIPGVPTVGTVVADSGIPAFAEERVRIYVFNDEASLRRKVRLGFVKDHIASPAEKT